jgi:hypothetical protein
MKAEVTEAESSYGRFLKARPQYSSPQEACVAYRCELKLLADARKKSVEELIRSAEDSLLRTDEQRRIMKLTSWISAVS